MGSPGSHIAVRRRAAAYLAMASQALLASAFFMAFVSAAAMQSAFIGSPAFMGSAAFIASAAGFMASVAMAFAGFIASSARAAPPANRAVEQSARARAGRVRRLIMVVSLGSYAGLMESGSMPTLRSRRAVRYSITAS